MKYIMRNISASIPGHVILHVWGVAFRLCYITQRGGFFLWTPGQEQDDH